MSDSGDSNPLANFAIGLLLGVGASFLYIRFGIEMPSAIGVGQRITSEAIVKTAELELYNSRNPPLVRHRALAMILANKPDVFLEVDEAIGHRFLNEFVRRHGSTDMRNKALISGDNLDSQLQTISPSKVGTTVIQAGTVLGSPVIGVAGKSNVVAESMLRQTYPDVTDETIKFLRAHPDIQVPSIQLGREASLPNMLQSR